MKATEINAVLSANATFYRAMQDGDAQLMERLWTRRRPVACTHPGGPMIQGRASVIESWRQIFSHSRGVPIRCVEPRAVVTGRTALVLCAEEVEGVCLIATNTFVREPGGWRMLTHQAAELP